MSRRHYRWGDVEATPIYETTPYIEVYEPDGRAYRLAHIVRAGTATRLGRPFPVEIDPAILVPAAH